MPAAIKSSLQSVEQMQAKKQMDEEIEEHWINISLDKQPIPSSRSRVAAWAKRENKTLSNEAMDALSKALDDYGSSAEEVDLGLILLGWELKRDQALVDVKDAHEAMQETMRQYLAQLRDFQEVSKILIEGFQAAQKEFMTLASDVRQALPSNRKTVQAEGSVRSEITTARQKEKNTRTSQTPPTTKREESPPTERLKLVKRFVKLSGKSYEDLKSYCPPEVSFAQILLDFVENMSPADWKLMEDDDDGKHKHIFLALLNDVIKKSTKRKA